MKKTKGTKAITITQRRRSYPIVNTDKIKSKIDNENMPIYRLAEKIGISEHTLDRINKGEQVTPKIVHKLSEYFRVNFDDFIIKKEKELSSGWQSINSFLSKLTNEVYLTKINSFSDLSNNPEYKISRVSANSPNQISHKIYKVDIKYDAEIDGIESFLKTFYKLDKIEGTTKTSNEKDIEEEINFLRKKISLNNPIEYLKMKNIGVYYGHYIYRAMEFLKYDDPDSLEGVGHTLNYDSYSYYRPTGKRIEVLLFYPLTGLVESPDKIKIYPETGYTEDELVTEYLNAYETFYGTGRQVNKEKLKKLKDYILYHSSNQWLTTTYQPDMPEIQDNPKEFLHPNFFINIKDKEIASDTKFKNSSDYNNYLKIFEFRNTFFSNLSTQFRFICKDNNSIPKYDGRFEEQLSSAERTARYRHENEFDNLEQLRLENAEDENE